MWIGHTWTKKDTMIKAVAEKELMGKRPLGRDIGWEDCAKRDVKAVDPRSK